MIGCQLLQMQRTCFTCSTMAAMRLRLGYPSGVDTIDVPALITTRLLEGRSARPRIMMVAQGVSKWVLVKKEGFCGKLCIVARRSSEKQDEEAEVLVVAVGGGGCDVAGGGGSVWQVTLQEGINFSGCRGVDEISRKRIMIFKEFKSKSLGKLNYLSH
jgi:hypothetical protein